MGLSECSNVLFGTVTEVNPKRMGAKVKPEENLKGETKFSQIKINIGVGQVNFPQQLIRKFKVGEPVIIFIKTKVVESQVLVILVGSGFRSLHQSALIEVRLGGILRILKFICIVLTKGQQLIFKVISAKFLREKSNQKKKKNLNLIIWQTLQKEPYALWYSIIVITMLNSQP